MKPKNTIRDVIRETLKEFYDEHSPNGDFVGIHCGPHSIRDNYDGTISGEYFGSFESVLNTIKNDYPDASGYLSQIEALDDGLDLYGDSADLVLEIESFFIENKIEWIYVATEALTKYGPNCYRVYFTNMNGVYRMDDELVDNASIYIYNSSNRPILEEI
jgi:hypothetical protein